MTMALRGPDLREGTDARRDPPLGPQDQLVGGDGRALRTRAGTRPIGTRRIAPPGPAEHHVRLVARQHRQRVAGRRCHPEVAADRPPVPDLRRTDRARRLHQRDEAGHLPNDPRVGHARRRATCDPFRRPPRLQLGEPARRRSCAAGPEIVEVDRHHHVGPAGDGQRLGPSAPSSPAPRPASGAARTSTGSELPVRERVDHGVARRRRAGTGSGRCTRRRRIRGPSRGIRPACPTRRSSGRRRRGPGASPA